MIKKEELLGLLKEALDAEEKALPIYTKHLETAVFWTGIDKGKTEQAKGLLRRLADETIKHKDILVELIKKIKGQNKDAF